MRRYLLPGTVAVLLTSPALAATSGTVERTWHGTQVHAYDAQAAGRYGAGVTVAVLDSWVDGSHPDFSGRVLAGADCASGTCTAGPAGRDACAHGTHVAGTVASTSYGVAPRATVLPVRVLTADSKGECTGTPTAVAAGIRWAVAHGAQVLNLSLGPDVAGQVSSQEIPQAVHEAAQAGAVLVFSAGNADLPVSQDYGDDALVVAATGPDGRLTSYTQYGKGVSVAAPGGQPDAAGACDPADCITSLYPGGRYAVAAGTSMAAPHVSGLAALLLGQDPRRGRADVLRWITGTAHPLSGAGAGLVDARAALGVRAAAPPPPHPAPVPARARPTGSAPHQPVPVQVRRPASSPVPARRRLEPVARRSAPAATTPPTSQGRDVTVLATPGPPRDREVPTGTAWVAGALVLVSAAGVGSTLRR